MATRAVLTPFAAEFPATNFPQLTLSNARPVLAFDTATSESAYWTVVAPQGLTGALSLVLTWAMASATSGNVIWRAAVEAISDGDATDTDASTSFDTANSSGAVAVPGTAGYIKQTVIALTNDDGVAAGDYVRISVDRDAANGSDTATGDAYLLAAELRDGA